MFEHKFGVFGIFVALGVAACQPASVPPDTPPVENEYITTVKISYQNQADATDKGVATWADLDNNAATPPDTSAAILNLRKSSQYRLEILFLDQTKTPTDTVSNEVQERANIHRICITTPTPIGFTATATDYDTNSPAQPLGLKQSVLTDASLQNGLMRLKLRHQPSGKDGTCEPGSSDIDVRFRVQKAN